MVHGVSLEKSEQNSIISTPKKKRNASIFQNVKKEGYNSMKKIDIFRDGQYLCTTTQAKTCKQAIANFYEKPWYEGMRKDGTIGKIIILEAKNITARFQK